MVYMRPIHSNNSSANLIHDRSDYVEWRKQWKNNDNNYALFLAAMRSRFNGNEVRPCEVESK